MNLSHEFISRMVSDITAAVPAESVYVFGSYARGEETPESDIDIFVVTKDDAESSLEYSTRVRLALPWINPWAAPGIPRSKDVLCVSRDTFQRRVGNVACMETIVAREGVKVYG